MSNFTVGKKIMCGFALTLAITVALGIFARSRLISISKIAHSITEDSLPGVYLMSEARAQVKDNLMALHSMFTAVDKAELADCERRYDEGRTKTTAILDKYAQTIFEARDKELYETLKSKRAAYLLAYNEVIALIHAEKNTEGLLVWKSKVMPAFSGYMSAIDALSEYNKDVGNASSVSIANLLSESEWGILIALLVALALGGVAAFGITRNVNGSLNAIAMTLRSSAEQVAAAATQVAQSSQSMASGASQQASSLEETSASLEEMASMTRQNADNARAARAVSDEASSAAEAGQNTTRKMGGELTARIGGMNDAIQKIKSSADQTAKIVKTIDEIAFQTNLLALNAAVEAARAGEAGKGFAVVAEEVRNLAQRSAEAAKNTAALIEESQRNAENGVKASSEVSEILKRAVEVEIAKSFSNTVDAANKVKQLIGEVAAASGEQSKGVEQINTAVSEMDKVTQSNAANAEESASASEELSAQSRELQDMVNALIKLIRGSSEAGSAPPPPQRAEKLQTVAPAKSHYAPAPKAARKASAVHVPTNRVATLNGHAKGHVNGTSNGNGKRKASVAIPLTDEELSGF